MCVPKCSGVGITGRNMYRIVCIVSESSELHHHPHHIILFLRADHIISRVRSIGEARSIDRKFARRGLHQVICDRSCRCVAIGCDGSEVLSLYIGLRNRSIDRLKRLLALGFSIFRYFFGCTIGSNYCRARFLAVSCITLMNWHKIVAP